MVYVQAKRWGRTVGTPDVSQFSGSLLKQNAQKGVMITTSQFSKDAREHVKGLAQKLVLIDGKQLAELMIEHDVGVQPASKKSYTLKRLDQEYFEAFDSCTPKMLQVCMGSPPSLCSDESKRVWVN
jgi:restriction system protein